MTPSVSVIVPAHNVAYCLGRCIESILSQSQPPGEIIVVNDGSVDATGDVARSFGNRIVYLEQDNRGPSAARNAGLRIAGGEYVAFLDADDYWLPDFVSACTGFLGRHSDAVSVSTAYTIRRFRSSRNGPAGLLADGADPNGYLLDNFFTTWAHHDHVRTGTVMIRREVVERAGYQLELRIGEDLEYWGYIATFGRWGFIPVPLWGADAARMGGARGWFEKYRHRWLSCPGVAQWQSRIVPRLAGEDWPGFRSVRGRVAKNFAYAKILARDFDGARLIAEEWAEGFPRDHIARLMHRGVNAGGPWWRACCEYLVLRDLCKGSSISLLARIRSVRRRPFLEAGVPRVVDS